MTAAENGTYTHPESILWLDSPSYQSLLSLVGAFHSAWISHAAVRGPGMNGHFVLWLINDFRQEGLTIDFFFSLARHNTAVRTFGLLFPLEPTASLYIL
jgi:hypothetical protein